MRFKFPKLARNKPLLVVVMEFSADCFLSEIRRPYVNFAVDTYEHISCDVNVRSLDKWKIYVSSKLHVPRWLITLYYISTIHLISWTIGRRCRLRVQSFHSYKVQRRNERRQRDSQPLALELFCFIVYIFSLLSASFCVVFRCLCSTSQSTSSKTLTKNGKSRHSMRLLLHHKRALWTE